jgi:radical SAM protein with 4Fe4S-binding SPASM domain
MSKKISNPLQYIYDLQNRPMAEKLNDIPAFPRMVDIELTNTCNMKCVMCPTGNGTVKREKGFMSMVTLEKVLDECAEHSVPVRYIRWGEPMLHPQFGDAIIESKTRNLISHINTNGVLLEEDTMRFLIQVGLDSIKFSMQGVNQWGYRDFRNSRQFHSLLNKIKTLHRMRDELDAKWPFIQIGTTITSEPDYLVAQFKRQVDSYIDAVYVGRTRDLQEKHPSSAAPCECPEVFDKLSINYDGSVSACCGDYDNFTIVGNVGTQSIKDIWESDKLASFRKMLVEYRHYQNYLCSRCARV